MYQSCDFRCSKICTVAVSALRNDRLDLFPYFLNQYFINCAPWKHITLKFLSSIYFKTRIKNIVFRSSQRPRIERDWEESKLRGLVAFLQWQIEGKLVLATRRSSNWYMVICWHAAEVKNQKHTDGQVAPKMLKGREASYSTWGATPGSKSPCPKELGKPRREQKTRLRLSSGKKL